MAIGTPATKADVNGMVTLVARQLHGAFNTVQQFKTWLDATTDAQLTAMGFDVSADTPQLRSAMVDADKLRTIFQGTGTQASTYDFRTFLKLALPGGTY
jgi:hypothetical protein